MICPNSIWLPNNTKNITIKKSLNDLILLIISNLYDDVAKLIPARSVPISIPKPNKWKILPNTKHRPIAKRNRYSWDSAIFSVILGIRYLLIKNTPLHKIIILRINWATVRYTSPHPILLKVANPSINSMTIISCITKIPTLNLP